MHQFAFSFYCFFFHLSIDKMKLSNEIYSETQYGITKTVINRPCFIYNNFQNASQWIFDRGIPERNLIDWCKEFLDSTKAFIDVGAHVGSYSILLSPFCSKVYSFEPQRNTFYQLCGSIALNNITNIYAYQYALSDSRQKQVLNVTSYDGGGSTLNQQVKQNVIHTELVNTQTLDSFSKREWNGEIPQIGLIKIDAEGEESKIILGAKTFLSSHLKVYGTLPRILFECWETQSQKSTLFTTLSDIGYQITNINFYPQMFLAHT